MKNKFADAFLWLPAGGYKTSVVFCAKPLNSTGSIAYTGDTVKWRFNPNGNIAQVLADVPHVSFGWLNNLSDCPFYASQKGRTNLVPYSDDLSQWVGLGTLPPTVAVDGSVKDVYGSYTSYRIDFGAVGNSRLRYLIGTLTDGQAYNLSVYVYAFESCRVRLGFSFGALQTFNLVPGWQRIDMTEVCDNGVANTQVAIYNDIDASTDKVIAAGFMVHEVDDIEHGPTTLIRTSGTVVTRNDEQYEANLASSAIDSSTSGTIYLEGHIRGSNGTDGAIELQNTAGDNRIKLTANGLEYIFSGVSAQIVNNLFEREGNVLIGSIAISWSGVGTGASTVLISQNGQTVDASGFDSWLPDLKKIIYQGTFETNYLKNLALWTTAKNQSQLNQLTSSN